MSDEMEALPPARRALLRARHRERKRGRERMRVSGKSVLLLHRLIQERARGERPAPRRRKRTR